MTSATQYYCKTKSRRALVRSTRGEDGKPILNGIDFVEVASPDQRTLHVSFIHPLPGQPHAVPPSPVPPLSVVNVMITGGSRVADIRVEAADAKGHVLTVTVAEPGDFSLYRLCLVRSAADPTAPAGFDPQLSQAAFSFKADCPSDFDCSKDPVCAPSKLESPEINYLAKDYAGFRRVMLDRLSLLLPQWKERHAADVGMALVEALAYVADHLSYQQDAVGTEAYLRTARRRISVRRHARLVDYSLFEGANARVWVHVRLKQGKDNVLLRRVTAKGPVKFLTYVEQVAEVVEPGSSTEEVAFSAHPVLFELMHDAHLFKAHEQMLFYTWGESECCLPKGATQATLKGTYDTLSKGTVLLVKEVRGPQTGREEDADPAHRHVIRLVKDALNMVDPLTQQAVAEIEWHPDDALPFPLCLSSKTDEEHGQDVVENVSMILGNIVLADHGRTLRESEDLGQVRSRRFRPALQEKPLTHAAPYPYRDGENPVRSAHAAMHYERNTIQPQVLSLQSIRGDAKLPWRVKADLLLDSQNQRDYVVEMENDGTAHLRFGDGTHGDRPDVGTHFTAVYRIGNGTQGNIGAGTLAHVITDNPDIAGVTNPMPAQGGEDPESLEQARQNAPSAFRTQDRAVTVEDYGEMTERYAGVQQAAASLRWTGSWYTVFVTVDRMGGRKVNDSFESEVRRHLERYRMAGHDIEIDNPRFVALEIELQVCVHPGYFRSHVKTELMQVFSNRLLPDGRKGAFHPDNFTFGQAVYLSPLHAAARSVAGVMSARIVTFQRQDAPSREAIEKGELKLGRLEIAQLDNDPNFPERGVLRIVIEGGK